MSDILYQEILNTILTADPQTSVALLQEAKGIFLDPIKGIPFHAEALYCAIKKTNKEVIQWLFKLPVHSDVAFFKFCGNTPIGMAIEEDHEELLPVLLEKTDKDFALHMAVKLHFTKTIRVLLNKCAFKDKFLIFLGLKRSQPVTEES